MQKDGHVVSKETALRAQRKLRGTADQTAADSFAELEPYIALVRSTDTECRLRLVLC